MWIMKYSALTLAFAALSFGSYASESDIETITIAHKQAFRGDIPLKELPQSITTNFDVLLKYTGIMI